MTTSVKLSYLKLSIPILIVLFLVILTRTIGFQQSPDELSIGVLLDLLVTIPVLFYFLIRNTQVPKITVCYTFLAGLLLASFIIPADEQQLLSKVKVIAIPIIEIGIVSMLLFKMSRLSKSLKKSSGDDFYDKLLLACNEVFPNRVGKILATEIAVFYYLFYSKKKDINSELEFTYSEKSGIKSIVVVFLFLISIETIVVHLLVSKWNVTVSWILSLLGLYTIIQVLAILRSMNKRLITIDYEAESLNLRYGFGSQTLISFDSIRSIEKSTKAFANEKSHVCLSLFDLLDSNNIVIHLNDENKLQKIYGMEKKYRSISLFIDESDLFVETIEEIISGN